MGCSVEKSKCTPWYIFIRPLFLKYPTRIPQYLLRNYLYVLYCAIAITDRGHFVKAPSQRETTLHCNVVSNWLGVYTKSSLRGMHAISCIDCWYERSVALSLRAKINQIGMSYWPLENYRSGWRSSSLMFWLIWCWNLGFVETIRISSTYTASTLYVESYRGVIKNS